MDSNNNNSSSNSNSNNNLGSTDNMSPSELKAYYKGLKRGIHITFITTTLRDAVMQNYGKHPNLRFDKGDPNLIAQDMINKTLLGIKQPVPTPQEMSVYDTTIRETGINILNNLVNMTVPAQRGPPKTTDNTPKLDKKDPTSYFEEMSRRRDEAIKNIQQQNQKQQKIPYNREQAKKDRIFELSDEQRKELR